MKLTTCTLTGADDHVDPASLAALSARHPIVEWGVLYCPSRTGNGRYPSVSWIRDLAKTARSHSMRWALHLCGASVHELLDTGRIAALGSTLLEASRWQLNVNTRQTPIDISRLQHLIDAAPRTIITQHNANNAELATSLSSANHAVLFDESGGRGKSPTFWRAPLERYAGACGYAGGIGPGNVASTLAELSGLCRDQAFWIDMEGTLRDADDRFDLAAAARVLGIVDEACKRSRMTAGTGRQLPRSELPVTEWID